MKIITWGRKACQFLTSNLNIHWIYELYPSEGDTGLEIKPTRISPILALIWIFIRREKIVVNLVIVMIAQRNPQSIMTCLVFDLQKVSNVLILSSEWAFERLNEHLKDCQRITLFSDFCTGQNKNRYISQMKWLRTLKTLNLKENQLIFPDKGHTQNVNYSIHSTIPCTKRV